MSLPRLTLFSGFAIVLLGGMQLLKAAPPARPTAANSGAAAQAIDCRELSSRRMSTITFEACEAQKASAITLQQMNSQSHPGGERPGDGSMTCTQIISEMQGMHFSGVSEATAARGLASGQALRSSLDRSNAQAATLAARQSAETAIAGMAPNAVQGAVQAKHSAEQLALQRNASNDMRDPRSATMRANADSLTELQTNLQANPRFGHLMQLAQTRNCQMSDAPVDPTGH